MRWQGQGELEEVLRALIAGERRRDLAAVCLALANTGRRSDVRALEGPIAVLACFVAGEAGDVAQAAAWAQDIASEEYAVYMGPLDDTSYGPTARASVVSAGCLAAAGDRWPDPEWLAYNALSSVAGGETPSADDVAIAIATVRALPAS